MKIALFILIIILILGLGIYFLNKEQKIQPRLLENMNKKNKTEVTPESAGKISITTVYDNYSADPRLKTAHGFSTLVTLQDQIILFDSECFFWSIGRV